ncbi:hypothetical protein [Phycicoccus flavus]|uniref:hypothetical protein n=1 Tax=Phycicoccus flavus TaxID=2502783 RepID=UPI000FEB5ED5|nr:hypothetical protein [Phycicoccus flavus]NHA67978.1 hypothetical protein [Phycicoccus flavus]
MSDDEAKTQAEQAEQAQAEEDQWQAEKPARQWREEQGRIAETDQLARAEEMGDRVETSIPAPDPEADETPGVIAERPVGEARESASGKRDAQHG